MLFSRKKAVPQKFREKKIEKNLADRPKSAKKFWGIKTCVLGGYAVRANQKVSTTVTQTRKFYFTKFPPNGLIFYLQTQNHVPSNRETFLSHF